MADLSSLEKMEITFGMEKMEKKFFLPAHSGTLWNGQNQTQKSFTDIILGYC